MEKAEVTTWFVDGQWFKHFLEISKLKEAVGTDTIFKYSMQRSERIDLFPLSVWKIEWFFSNTQRDETTCLMKGKRL